jgi:type II secretory pathway component PulM
MKKYFSQLRPFERRLVVGVMVVVFVVLNLVYVEPHFSDWSKLRNRGYDADRKLQLYQRNIAQIPTLQTELKGLEKQGEFVAFEDQGINFSRTVAAQAQQSGVAILSTSTTHMHTNDAFFVEQVQTIHVSATDQQLVDFLYKLGSDASMIRVHDLELQSDMVRQHLSADITLVASFQKNPPKADDKFTTVK